MNYHRHYELLIQKHGYQQRPDLGYYERHHIVPRSHGGGDEAENLVYLSGRCHFIAHWLLWRMHRDRPMASAFWAMATGFTRPAERKKAYRVTSTGYEAAKAAQVEKQSEYQSWYKKNHYHQYRGKTLSEEHRAKMSETRKKIGRTTPDYVYAEWLCPHCGKVGKGMSNATRWHFDNCSSLKKST